MQPGTVTDFAAFSQLGYSALTRHLLDQDGSQAFYIDTSKSFDPRRLAHSIRASLAAERDKVTHGGGYAYARQDDAQGTYKVESVVGDSEDHMVTAALDRTSVMRVFDFEGLLDAVLEVKARLHQLAIAVEQNNSTLPEHISRVMDQGQPQRQHAAHLEPAATQETRPDHSARGKEIADSQADSDIYIDEGREDSDDEEMLLDPLLTKPLSDSARDTPSTFHQIRQQPPRENGPYLLLLPSPARVLSPAMHINHVRAHGLLVHLMRTLHHMTQQYPLCILLLNSMVERASADHEEGPSAFASNASTRPALGKTWDWFLDLSCMITTPFKGCRKVEKTIEKLEKEYVFEILHDRSENNSVGRWAVIDF